MIELLGDCIVAVVIAWSGFRVWQELHLIRKAMRGEKAPDV